MPDYIEENTKLFPEIGIMFVLRTINSLNYDLRCIQSRIKCHGNVTRKMLANLLQEMQTLKENNDYIIDQIIQELSSCQD